jgi:hypothetical protein
MRGDLMRRRLWTGISTLAVLAVLAAPTSSFAKVVATRGVVTGEYVETYFPPAPPADPYCVQRMKFTLVGQLSVGGHVWRGTATTPTYVDMGDCGAGTLASFTVSGSNGWSSLSGTCGGSYDIFGINQLNASITCTATITNRAGGRSGGALRFLLRTQAFQDPTFNIADQCDASLPCENPPGNTTGSRFVGTVEKS